MPKLAGIDMAVPELKVSEQKLSATRQQRVQIKEHAIIKAARDMFLEHGFRGTTMARIARAANVADGTVYTYFENKEALARAVVADFYAHLTHSAQAGVDSLHTARERLQFLACHHLLHVMEALPILEMLPFLDVTMDSYEESELYGLNKNYVVIFNRIVKDGQAQGEIRADRTLWVLRDMFFGALDYGSKTMTLKARDGGFEVFASEIVDLICARQAQVAQNQTQNMQGLVQRLEQATDRIERMSTKL